MANTRSATKRIRQNFRNASRNTSALRALKTQQKKFFHAVKEGNKEIIYKTFTNLSSSFDKAVKRGLVHRNLANRKKSLASGILLKSVRSNNLPLVVGETEGS